MRTKNVISYPFKPTELLDLANTGLSGTLSSEIQKLSNLSKFTVLRQELQMKPIRYFRANHWNGCRLIAFLHLQTPFYSSFGLITKQTQRAIN